MEYKKINFRKKNSNSPYQIKDIIKFIIPSLVGMLLFMIPMAINEQITIPVGFLSKWAQEIFSNVLPITVLIVTLISAIGTLFTKLFNPSFVRNTDFLNNLFNISWVWATVRLLAVIFLWMTYFEVGIPSVYASATGGLILDELLPVLFPIFLFAGLFLPLLLDFGLLEFIGTLLAKIMRPVFNLPGRSAVDCIASWLGDGTLSIILTSKQYEEGYYTKRESAVISTTFSLVSITFSLVIINTVGLSHMFVPFYFSLTVASIAAIFILPKLPPLSKKSDTYVDDSPLLKDEGMQVTDQYLARGFQLAIEKAKSQNLVKTICVDGVKNVIDMWLAVIPSVMGIGTIALIIAEYTPVFRILGWPFIPILMVLGVPEAVAASQTLVVGFADMLLPAIMASNIESEFTRFVIAAVSVSQLIYISEVGAVILASKIPLSVKELFVIFLQRTLITLPIIAILARLFF